MKIKEVWTDENFEEMGWHDSHVHAISLPNNELELSLDIDYLVKWIRDDTSDQYNFWVSPCILLFFNVMNLKIFIDLQNTIGLDISEINRKNPRLSPNGNTTLWDFEILMDKGSIIFESSGYKQFVKKQPIFSRNQVLPRVKW